MMKIREGKGILSKMGEPYVPNSLWGTNARGMKSGYGLSYRNVLALLNDPNIVSLEIIEADNTKFTVTKELAPAPRARKRVEGGVPKKAMIG